MPRDKWVRIVSHWSSGGLVFFVEEGLAHA